MCSSILMWAFIILLIVSGLFITSITYCREDGNCFSLFCFTVFFVIILKHRHSEFIKIWVYEILFNSVLIVINKKIIFFRVIFTSAFFIWVFALQILIFYSFFFSVCVFFFMSLLMLLSRDYFFSESLTFIISDS